MGRILYESVATLKADEMIPEVESVYDKVGVKDTEYSAKLYWTIRVMEGKKALRLRKKIRTKVGMSRLNDY